jgi:hypothetical protein
MMTSAGDLIFIMAESLSQNRGARILEPESWSQSRGVRILEPDSRSQNRGEKNREKPGIVDIRSCDFFFGL